MIGLCMRHVEPEMRDDLFEFWYMEQEVVLDGEE